MYFVQLVIHVHKKKVHESSLMKCSMQMNRLENDVDLSILSTFSGTQVLRHVDNDEEDRRIKLGNA